MKHNQTERNEMERKRSQTEQIRMEQNGIGWERNTYFRFHLSPANREGALIQSLGSASVMYTLIRNCRAGEYQDCGCAGANRPRPGQEWQWAGCEENLSFGENMAKHFIDKLEKNSTDHRRVALNLHNNEVGRKVSVASTNRIIAEQAYR